MAVFYRGAGVGTHWHLNDAKILGFVPQSPGMARSVATMMSHIKDGTTNSPFISLTRSYSVALSYAVYAGLETPTPERPAYVYAVEIPKKHPKGLTILDPAREILSAVADPFGEVSYQHDGFPDFLLGVIQPSTMGEHLHKPISHPPPSDALARPANLDQHLEAIIRALRDSELLVVGTIPATCVIHKYPVYKL